MIPGSDKELSESTSTSSRAYDGNCQASFQETVLCNEGRGSSGFPWILPIGLWRSLQRDRGMRRLHEKVATLRDIVEISLTHARVCIVVESDLQIGSSPPPARLFIADRI